MDDALTGMVVVSIKPSHTSMNDRRITTIADKYIISGHKGLVRSNTDNCCREPANM
jgi:hypothetical protein